MALRVSVIGAAGYVGGELLRLLLQHPEVADLVATSRSKAGVPVGEVHPALAPLTDVRLSGASPAEASRQADVVFLALEHGESSRVAEEVFAVGPGLVIDLAADFRVSDLDLYARFYGRNRASC
jgi:N-acetyl-gamma-glutamylphosphate reductase